MLLASACRHNHSPHIGQNLYYRRGRTILRHHNSCISAGTPSFGTILPWPCLQRPYASINWPCAQYVRYWCYKLASLGWITAHLSYFAQRSVSLWRDGKCEGSYLSAFDRKASATLRRFHPPATEHSDRWYRCEMECRCAARLSGHSASRSSDKR